MSKQDLELKEVDFAALFASEEDGKEVEDTEKTDDNKDGEDNQEDDLNPIDIFEKEIKDEEDLEEKETGGKKIKHPDSTKSKDADGKSKSNEEAPFPVVFAKFRVERGVLNDFDEDELRKIVEEDGDEAAMDYITNIEIEGIKNQLLESYDDDVKFYLDLVDSGVERDDAKQLIKRKADFERITMDSLEDEDNGEELRRKVLTENYKLTTQFNDAKIKKIVDTIMMSGDDIEEAQEALKEINEKYAIAAKTAKEAAIKADRDREELSKQQIRNIEKFIDDTQEIIPGSQLTSKEKKELKEMILKPIGNDKNGNPINAIWSERLKDPIKFDMAIAYFIKNGGLTGKFDKIEKRVKSRTVQEMKNSMKPESLNMKNTFNDNSSSNGIDEMKKAFRL
jgi:hypothetical protein